MSFFVVFKIVRSYLLKFRRWGFAGLWGWVCRRMQERRERNRFLANVKTSHGDTVRGVTVIAELSGRSGLSKAMRDFVRLLKTCDIPCQTYDLSKTSEAAAEDLKGLLTPVEDFDLRRYSAVVDLFDSPYPRSFGLKHGRVAFWEAESGFADVYPEIGFCGGLIGMSDYNVEYFRREYPDKPVWKILYPFRFSPGEIGSRDDVRARYGIGRDDFVVYFNFDYASGFDRKNPEAAIEAFALALGGCPTAKLLFKTKSAKRYPTEQGRVHAAVEKHGLKDRFIEITAFVPEADLYGLTNACDVYLSLHRGEGFGLGIAEAMCMGKPVVVTNYSSPTEFCNERNAILVPYKMVPLTPEQRKFVYYISVREWAEPDVRAAAEALRRLYDDPALRERLGASAAASLREHFSMENFKRSVDAFLDS